MAWSVETDKDDKPTQYEPIIGKIIKSIPSDVYDIVAGMGRIYLKPLNFFTGDIVRFTDSKADEVIADIEKFWHSKSAFEAFEFPYKKGILLHGPAGSGKTSIIKLVIKDIIKRNGLALRFQTLDLFILGLSYLRNVEPDRSVVVIMEDLDELVARNNLSELLNMLDGLTGFENVVYLATTNFPQKLEARIINRPSRFDRRYEIGYPDADLRRDYIKHLAKKVSDFSNDMLTTWVRDTIGLTFAHIKELYISVFVYKHDYQEVLKRLKEMKEPLSSDNYEDEDENPWDFERGKPLVAIPEMTASPIRRV